MPAVDQFQGGIFMNGGTAIVVAVGGFGKGKQGVDFTNDPGHALDARTFRCNFCADVLKEAKLQFGDFFLGSGYFDFIFFQFRRDVALGIDQRLFADIFFRDAVDVFFGHFDVVSVDSIEPYLQNGNPGAFLFPGFESGDPGFAVPADRF